MAITRYQASLIGDNTSIANFRAWAGDVTGVAYALGAMGFTKQADTYTAQWATAVAVGSAALPTVAGNLDGTAFPAGSNPLPRAALASTHFMGVWDQGVYNPGDVVIWTGASSPSVGETNLTYICVSATTNTTGEIPSNTTYWSPYYMEIWKSGGSLTPIYIKMEYGCGSSPSWTQMYFQLGTGWSSGNSGYLTGNTTLCEATFTGSSTLASTECDFCGDGNNFFVANLYRGGISNNGPSIFGWERSINGQVSSAPNYTSDYVTYIRGYNNPQSWAQQTLFLSGSPVTATRVLYGATLTVGGASQSLTVNTVTPVFPVFPVLGYYGDPMTILVAQNVTDTTEGGQITCTVYGRTNNYMMTKTAFAQGIGGIGQTTFYGVGTRFDSA